ncbi:hypothetical protein KPH14_006874 [Odynerus spinipes]|uniref:G-protein coupled receptors family 1 profile domain-containing protein n=1 Tax=Odynerus spinipes TaxID=1348599 RepID=A0AAD9RRJ1_9HYME|nr:hypothetical protein KPH14_006874 [Odynerus spinipes]
MGELDSILLTSFAFAFLSFHVLESEAIEETLGRCCVKPSVTLLEEEEETRRETRCAPLEDDANRTLLLIEDNSETTSSVVDSWVCFDACFEYQPNGSFVVLRTFENRSEWLEVKPEDRKSNGSLCKTNDDSEEETKKSKKGDEKTCRSILTPLSFWGANIVVFANVIYIAPYVIVIFIYSTVSGIRKRAYDGAVISYNITQIVLNSILIAVGWLILCQATVHISVYTFSCLALMFLSISSTFWLFVICIDMTLVITRFRWTPPADPKQQRTQEKRKFLVYSAWVWGASFVPTAFACIVELSSFVPESSPIKPNFGNFANGPNVAVIVYVATLPVLVCLMNSALFFYTTYKIITMKKSTSIASKTSTKAKESYFMFLKLYFLMDAPWVTSTLGAIYTELWVFKFFRMIQPILMLIVILPRGTFTGILRKCGFSKRSKEAVDSDGNAETKRNICERCTVTRL